MDEATPDAKQIFLEALDRQSPEDLQRYLDEACGDNTELRARIEALLRAHREVGDFLADPPSAGVTIDQRLTESPGTQIGPYKLLQQLGEGGFGVVYMAEQSEPVERRVALKIIKPGMDTQQVIARFEAEEQALAMMDHPNIARVFEVGTTDSGRPYFAMELVRGIPITQYCDEHHLASRERLELFVPVCHAIQHAHQKGIIHRDIKPTNVLVAEYDDRPVPKIIDFGVAKAIQQRLTERTMFTQFGQVVGTIDYMSPEQAKLNELDIDTRSDIYSLGVLLYELLTGETPFDRQRLRSAAFDELLRIIREEEPPKPSKRLSSSHSLPSIAANQHTEPKKLSALVRGELDWIVMKALEKDRARRYETANGLANDIRRYLNDEPVLACPPSAAYRIRKFTRRNKAAIAVAALIAAALVIATGISLGQAARATQAAIAERQAYEQAREAELDAKRQLFAAALAQANASRSSGRQGQRLEALKAIEAATPLLKPLGLAEEARLALRNEAIGSQELVDLRLVKKWQARQSLAEGYATFSADFELLAFSHNEWIHVRRTDAPTTDVARIPVTKGTSPYFLSFDPSKQYLVRLRHPEYTVYVAEIASAKDILVVPDTIWFAAADFHPRSPHIAVGDRHGVVHFFDLVSGREIRKWSIGRPILSLKYDRQGRRLAVGSGQIKDAEIENEELDANVHLFVLDVCDAETGQVVFKVPEPGVLYPRDWSPDGKWLAVGAVPDVHLFEVGRAEGRHLVLQGHRSQVTGLQFHPQGRILASTSWDGTTRLWDAATGQQLLRFEGRFNGFSSDGRQMSCLQGLDISLLEVLTPCAHRWLFCGKTHAVAVAPRDRLLATCHDDGVRLWDLDHLEQVANLPVGVTRGVAFRPPAGQLVTSGEAGLYQWPIRTEIEGDVERVHVGPPQAIDASLKDMRSAHFSGDGSVLLAEALFRGEAFLLHLAESSPRRLRLTRPHLSLTALSPDGNWAAASDFLGVGTVGIWNARTGEHVCDLPTLSGSQICFSPDGRTVITNCGLEMQIWDVGTWKPRFKASFQSDSASAVAFTPDSRLAAVGVWGVGAMLMEVDTGRRVAMLDLPEKPPVYVGLSFTSDGSRLMAAVDYMGCCVWDIRALRDRLAALGLDWDQPSLAKPPRAKPNLLRVEFDLGILADVMDQPNAGISPAMRSEPGSAERGESAAPKGVEREGLLNTSSSSSSDEKPSVKEGKKP